MIEVKGREMVIPREEFNIGTTYDARSEMRHFHMRRVRQGGIDLAGLVFNLDIEYANGKTDTATLTKDVTNRDIDLMLTIEPTMLQVPGTVIIQIRALAEDGTVKWSSYKGAFFVEDCINTPAQYEGKITQLEQYEAEWGTVRDNVRALNSRMDEIVKMADGIDASDVEKEVTDVRVGADGKKYESAGSAVREQITAEKNKRTAADAQLNEAIANLSVFVTPQMFGAKGDGVMDDTEAIQSAIDYAFNSKKDLHFPNGVYLVDVTKGINVVSKANCNIILSKNAEIKAIPCSLESYWIFEFQFCDNVTISGGKLTGERNEHEGTTGELGFGISIRSCSNFTISDMTISNCWGDGIQLGTHYNGYERSHNENVIVRNVICQNNRRNNMAVTNGNGVTISDCHFIGANGTDPKAGLDLEPTYDFDVIRNIIIKDCKFIDNTNYGLCLWEMKLNPSVTIDNCFFEGSGIGISESTEGYGSVVINNPVLKNLTKPTFLLRQHSSKCYPITINNPTIINPMIVDNTSGTKFMYYSLITHNRSDVELGGVVFHNIRIIADETNFELPFIYTNAKETNLIFTFDYLENYEVKFAGTNANCKFRVVDNTGKMKKDLTYLAQTFTMPTFCAPRIVIHGNVLTGELNASYYPRNFITEIINKGENDYRIDFKNITTIDGQSSITIPKNGVVRFYIDEEFGIIIV